MEKLKLEKFMIVRREPLLDYNVYEYNFDGPMEGFVSVRENLTQMTAATDVMAAYDQMVWTKQRAWDSLDFLINCYSGGHSLEELSGILPAILEYWSDYARRSAFLIQSDSESPSVAHIPLLDWEFSFANQLVCFSILFGQIKMLPEIYSIINFNNPHADGMLARMTNGFLGDGIALPKECIRHLPYSTTLKIFNADPNERAEMMAEYLHGWYAASRREIYYDSHKKRNSFRGYWSWEAAAITYLLNIDDSCYRDAKFYPADLVEFARDAVASRGIEPPAVDEELRAESGQVCPKSGIWEALDIPLQKKRFSLGERMQAADDGYGLIVWRYIGE